jgi:hypothetical protein
MTELPQDGCLRLQPTPAADDSAALLSWAAMRITRAWLPIEVIHRGCTRMSPALFTGRDNIAGCTVTTS